MTGTVINIITVLVGGGLGLVFGAKLSEKIKQTVIAGLGLYTFAYGVMIFMDSNNTIIVLVSVLVGGILGEVWQIEDRLHKLGAGLEKRFAGGKGEKEEGSSFVLGFITASLVFCVGPMTILGSIQDGLEGDYSTLAIKSVLDGFASLAFASTMGVGVLFSVLVILGFQGGLSLLAMQAQNMVTSPMIAEMSAVGGVLLMGIAISRLLEIKQIRVGNFLPALLIAPLIVAVLTALNISYGL